MPYDLPLSGRAREAVGTVGGLAAVTPLVRARHGRLAAPGLPVLFQALQPCGEPVLQQVDGLGHGAGGDVRAGRTPVDVQIGLGDRRPLHGGVGHVGQFDAGEQDRFPRPAGEHPGLLPRVLDGAGRHLSMGLHLDLRSSLWRRSLHGSLLAPENVTSHTYLPWLLCARAAPDRAVRLARRRPRKLVAAAAGSPVQPWRLRRRLRVRRLRDRESEQRTAQRSRQHSGPGGRAAGRGGHAGRRRAAPPGGRATNGDRSSQATGGSHRPIKRRRLKSPRMASAFRVCAATPPRTLDPKRSFSAKKRSSSSKQTFPRCNPSPSCGVKQGTGHRNRTYPDTPTPPSQPVVPEPRSRSCVSTARPPSRRHRFSS